MKYMLLGYVNEGQLAAQTPEQMQAAIGAHMAYVQALKEAGAWLDNKRLVDSNTAATVRQKDGKSQVLDGPYTDTKEQFGGYWIIEAPDMDAALAWAARCPIAQHGIVEVRQVWAPPA
jgi:hypothetical protein